MLESLLLALKLFPYQFCKTFTDTFFTEQLRWLLLIILGYIILYLTRTAHPLTRRISLALYELS